MALAGESEEAGQHALLCGHRALPLNAADTAFKRLALAGSVSRDASRRQQKENVEVELNVKNEDEQHKQEQQKREENEAKVGVNKLFELFGEWLTKLKKEEDKMDQVNPPKFLFVHNSSMNRIIHGKPL